MPWVLSLVPLDLPPDQPLPSLPLSTLLWPRWASLSYEEPVSFRSPWQRALGFACPPWSSFFKGLQGQYGLVWVISLGYLKKMLCSCNLTPVLCDFGSPLFHKICAYKLPVKTGRCLNVGSLALKQSVPVLHLPRLKKPYWHSLYGRQSRQIPIYFFSHM